MRLCVDSASRRHASLGKQAGTICTVKLVVPLRHLVILVSFPCHLLRMNFESLTVIERWSRERCRVRL